MPLHLGSLPDAMAHVRLKFAGRHEPGDVFLSTIRSTAGRTCPTSTSSSRSSRDGAPAAGPRALATSRRGRKTAGRQWLRRDRDLPGGAPHPAAQAVRGPVAPVEALFELIERNVRVPRQVLGDVRAQLAACEAGSARTSTCSPATGPSGSPPATTALLDQAERLARTAIRAMPDGTLRVHRLASTTTGVDPDPIPLPREDPTIAGDRLVADLTGSAPQVKGGINSPIPFTKSAVYATVRHLIGGQAAEQRGLLPADRGHCPVRHDREPRAAGRGGRPRADRVPAGQRRSSSPSPGVAPDRIFACEVGGDTGVSIGGYDADRPPLRVPGVPVRLRGGPAGPGRRGRELPQRGGRTSRTTRWRSSRPSIRSRSSATGFLPDTGDPRRFRGGLALVREYRFLEAEGVLQSGTTGGDSRRTGWRAGTLGPCW